MKSMLKSLRVVVDVTGALVFASGLLLCVAHVTMSPRKLEILVNSTGAFIKKSLKHDPFAYANEPDKFEKIVGHLKLLSKAQYPAPTHGYELNDNAFGLHLSFPDYAMIDLLMNEIFIHKVYAFQTNNPEPFIIDAGSNIGVSILFFKKMYPNARIVGFEPSQKNFSFLEKNINNNHLTQVNVFNKALAAREDQEIKLYFPGTTHGTVIGASEASSDYEVAKTVSLSNYINHTVDLLKMDIEGAEYEVFQDLFDNDKLKFVQKIIMEYHVPECGLAKLLAIFDQSGFHYEIKNDFIYAYKKQ